MNDLVSSIRQTAKKLLEEGKVDVIIGFEKGTLPLRCTPVFVRKPEDVDKLTWNSSCENNLAKYLVGRKGKIGIIAKGCDSRAIVELLQEKQLDRGNLVIIGVPCQGMIDRNKVEQAVDGKEVLTAEDKGNDILLKGDGFEKTMPKADLMHSSCKTCRHHNPVVYDVLVGEKVPENDKTDEYADIKEFEKKSPEERWKYITDELSKCIRCYGCRNACPLCYCRECFVDCTKPQWIGKTIDATDTQLFHMIRALHLAGRCVSCGACERACPMGIDLRILNKKLCEDVDKLFGHEAGISPEQKPALATYKVDDQQEFIK